MVVLNSTPVDRGDDGMLGSVPRRGKRHLPASGAHDIDAQARHFLSTDIGAQQAQARMRRSLDPHVPPARSTDWEAQLEAEVPSVASYEKQFERSHLCFEREEAKLFNDLKPQSFAERMANPLSSDTTRRTGRERLALLRQAFGLFHCERSDMQKQFHEDMIGACARLIFKNDLESELDDLLLELGVDELHSEFMAITPRRFGKTYSVAMFVVAMAWAVEGVEQAIFSTGRRASQKLLELVYRFICEIPGMKESIVKHNVETIWIRGPDGDIRKIFSYPSNVRISSLVV